MEFLCGLSGDVILHQLMASSSKHWATWRDVCFGSLSCMKWWPSGYTFLSVWYSVHTYLLLNTLYKLLLYVAWFLVWGIFLSSCHKFSMGLMSGLSGGVVLHQLMPSSSKHWATWRDVRYTSKKTCVEAVSHRYHCHIKHFADAPVIRRLNTTVCKVFLTHTVCFGSLSCMKWWPFGYTSLSVWYSVPLIFCSLPCTSSSFVCGLISHLRYSLISCHKFSMGLMSGLFGGVLHQLLPSSSKQWATQRDVCFGLLSCIKWWPSGYTSCRNGRSVRLKNLMVMYNSASMIPSNTKIPVLPHMLIPAQMWTFTGCLGRCSS